MEHQHRPVNDIYQQISKGGNSSYKGTSLNDNRIIVRPSWVPHPNYDKIETFFITIGLKAKIGMTNGR